MKGCIYKDIYFIMLLLILAWVNFAICSDEIQHRSNFTELTSNNYSAYLTGAVCNPSEPIRILNSVAEVIQIIHEAIRLAKTVKAFGQRHSLTDIICTKGIPIDMSKIQGMTINPEDNSVKVGAGVNVRDLCDFLLEHGRALKVIPGFGNITIGGALGTGAHGSSLRHHSSISEQVIGLTIIDGLGNVKEITKEEDLNAFRIHLGLLGILVHVTLATTPLYKVHAHSFVRSDSILTNISQLTNLVNSIDQISIYWFPPYSKVVITNLTILEDINIAGDSFSNDPTPPTTKTFNINGGLLLETAQATNNLILLNTMQKYLMETLFHQVPDFLPIYTDDNLILKNPAVGYYHKMFAPICDNVGDIQCPWLHGKFKLDVLDIEIGISLKDLPNFSSEVKDILNKHPAFPLRGFLLRFSASSKIYMSESFGKDTCHFEFFRPKRTNRYETAVTGLPAYQAILQLSANKYKGFTHWGKSGHIFHSKDMLNLKLDPTAKELFISKMNEYDPNGLFINNFGRRLKGIGTQIDLDPKTQHCALLDNCFCSENDDCTNEQTCGRIVGYPSHPVCKDSSSPLILELNEDTNPVLPNSSSLVEWVNVINNTDFSPDVV